eukprot:288458-Rhodomonas_salina.1
MARRIIRVWKRDAAACEAALECHGSPASQEFCATFLLHVLPYFVGTGETDAGSSVDDWCSSKPPQRLTPSSGPDRAFQDNAAVQWQVGPAGAAPARSALRRRA